MDITSQELLLIFSGYKENHSVNQDDYQHTLRMQASSQLYLENDTSALHRIKGDLQVEILESTTFQCARESAEPGLRTAVLNFANPREPGGGVLRGAMNQEECLCRCSDLYNALAQPYFLQHYYQHHVRHCDDFFSDRLIDAPNVTVIKSDDAMPQVLSKPFYVDVLTCAAPYIHNPLL